MAARVQSVSLGDLSSKLKDAGVRLNKKGALESLLKEAIYEVAELEKPSMRAQRVTKFEAGQNRLLLSGHLAYYVLQSVFVRSIERFMKTDIRYYAPETTYDEYLDAVWRYRTGVRRSEQRLSHRCFDFDDFNAQHSLLQMWIWHTA